MNLCSRWARLSATLAAFAALAFPVAARAASFVHDGANMLSPTAAARLDRSLSAFNAETGKQVVVVTVPSLGGTGLHAAAQQAFSQYAVNGVMIFVAMAEHKDIIVPDAAGVRAGWFTPSIVAPIRQAMEAQFKAADFNGGITDAAGTLVGIYRSHLGSLQNANAPARSYGVPATVPAAGIASPVQHRKGPNVVFWLIVFIVGFLVLRSIMRASAQRPPYGPMTGPMAGGPPAGPVAPTGGAPMGQPMGYGGGGMMGGGFLSGLLGGLGGAWLGNQLFGGGGMMGGGMMGGGSNIADASQMGAPDAGGWGGDAGQADMGGASSGDFGGGGFGDMGGGGFGGGDMGGGGDSGGW